MRRLPVMLAVTVLALTTACGDDDDTDTTTPAATAEPTAESTATTEPTATGEAPADGQTLIGEVGENDSFTITLNDDSGEPVTSLPAGTYTLQISDLSDIHNFHLTGPGGVDESTTVTEVTDVTWEVTFEPGTYTYICDPHPANMRGEFEVT